MIDYLKRWFCFQILYFLKPVDSINDAVTSELVERCLAGQTCDCETGVGDGVYTAVRNGWVPSIFDDRYRSADTSHKDIFINGFYSIRETKADSLGLKFLHDFRSYHRSSIDRIFPDVETSGSLRDVISYRPNLIFAYTAHGADSYRDYLQQILNLNKTADVIILVFNNAVQKYFLNYRIGIFFQRLNCKLATWFLDKDGGRAQEIAGMSATLENWNEFFDENGYKVERFVNGLSPTTWLLYDTQTRYILKFLINIYSVKSFSADKFFKISFLLLTIPFSFVLAFIEYFRIGKSENNLYFCFRLSLKDENYCDLS